MMRDHPLNLRVTTDLTSEVIDRRREPSIVGQPKSSAQRRRDHDRRQAIAIRYIELWNERTPARRREILAANWTSDARYVDPLMSGEGHDGVDALIAGVQQHFPDFISR